MESLELTKETKSKLRKLSQSFSTENKKSTLHLDEDSIKKIVNLPKCSQCSVTCKGYCTSSCYGGFIGSH